MWPGTWQTGDNSFSLVNTFYTLLSLANRNYSLIVLSALSGLYSSLHHCGMQLDTLYKDQLDKLMVRFLAAKTQLYKSYCLWSS